MEEAVTVPKTAWRERSENRRSNGTLYQIIHRCSECTTQVSPMHRYCNYCGALFEGTRNS